LVNQLLKAAAGIDFNTFIDRLAISDSAFGLENLSLPQSSNITMARTFGSLCRSHLKATLTVVVCQDRLIELKEPHFLPLMMKVKRPQ
jgi:hypothetical protein